MKLRNKKTGEIKEVEPITIGGFRSLAELNAEWCDYEEPKEYWFIDYDGGIIPFSKMKDTATDKSMKQIGNYFETKEEAEKAVEKLKAWKRLKEARFEFGSVKYNLDEESSSLIAYDGIITIKGMAYEDFVDDLNLLFGGEK